MGGGPGSKAPVGGGAAPGPEGGGRAGRQAGARPTPGVRPACGATSCVLAPQLQNIASHSHLLTVHDFEQEGSEELDTVILKALVKGEGQATHLTGTGGEGSALLGADGRPPHSPGPCCRPGAATYTLPRPGLGPRGLHPGRVTTQIDGNS